jgi:nucleotide-binding universal stress UspA family protein
MHISLDRGILVATDGSVAAARAETVAATIAAGCGRRLMIATISRGLPAEDLRRLARTQGDLGAARHALIEEILNGAAERARRCGVTDIRMLTGYGDPGKAIVALAEAEKVDLIVIGRRGLGGLSSWLLGSVSKSIIDHARCAVTVVP